jgi:hypothetical protein
MHHRSGILIEPVKAPVARAARNNVPAVYRTRSTVTEAIASRQWAQ